MREQVIEQTIEREEGKTGIPNRWDKHTEYMRMRSDASVAEQKGKSKSLIIIQFN